MQKKAKSNTNNVQGYSDMVDKDQLILQKDLQGRFLKIFD